MTNVAESYFSMEYVAVNWGEMDFDGDPYIAQVDV